MTVLPFGRDAGKKVSADTKHSCETCKWRGECLADADEDDPALYLCAWPAELLPASLRFANRERVAVRGTDGTDCPTWEP